MSVSILAPSSVNCRLDDLEKVLHRAWSRETSLDQLGWQSTNPAWGQCAVTALVVQDFVGGSIRRGLAASGSHYWNRLPSGEEIDLTRHQFDPEVALTSAEDRERDYLLSDAGTQQRYEMLRSVVASELRCHGDG